MGARYDAISICFLSTGDSERGCYLFWFCFLSCVSDYSCRWAVSFCDFILRPPKRLYIIRDYISSFFVLLLGRLFLLGGEIRRRWVRFEGLDASVRRNLLCR